MPAPAPQLAVGALPCFNARGDLVITAATDDQFKYWRDGAQSIWQTLADLSADAATVRRYAAKERHPRRVSDDPRPRMEKACERLSEPPELEFRPPKM